MDSAAWPSQPLHVHVRAHGLRELLAVPSRLHKRLFELLPEIAAFPGFGRWHLALRRFGTTDRADVRAVIELLLGVCLAAHCSPATPTVTRRPPHHLNVSAEEIKGAVKDQREPANSGRRAPLALRG